MNKIELETRKVYREWTDIVSKLRVDLNKIRKKDLSNMDIMLDKKAVTNIMEPSELKVGDLVHRKLNKPKNALNDTLNSDVFREGDYRWDVIPVKINEVLYYAGDVTYRYMINGIKNASFTEDKLMLAEDQEEDEQVEIKKIIDRRFFNDEENYHIWMYGELRKDAGWYGREELLKTGNKKLLEDFDKEFDKKKKKKR
jgi:hypothetical protein